MPRIWVDTPNKVLKHARLLRNWCKSRLGGICEQQKVEAREPCTMLPGALGQGRVSLAIITRRNDGCDELQWQVIARLSLSTA